MEGARQRDTLESSSFSFSLFYFLHFFSPKVAKVYLPPRNSARNQKNTHKKQRVRASAEGKKKKKEKKKPMRY